MYVPAHQGQYDMQNSSKACFWEIGVLHLSCYKWQTGRGRVLQSVTISSFLQIVGLLRQMSLALFP
jgi:hypothetical protein